MTKPAYRTLPFPRLKHAKSFMGAQEPCVRCQKPLRRTRYMVHVINGGNALLYPQDEQLYKSDNVDLYWLPIGTDCAKPIGLEWCYELEHA